MRTLRISEAAETEGSDNWGSGFLADAVAMFVWACVALAVLIAVVVVLQSVGRRRAAERENDRSADRPSCR